MERARRPVAADARRAPGRVKMPLPMMWMHEATVESRIEALECKLMDAEDQLETLNLTVYRQQQRIELLERQVAELGQLVRSRLPERGLRPEDEIPPHY
jgi:SlyX protein